MLKDIILRHKSINKAARKSICLYVIKRMRGKLNDFLLEYKVDNGIFSKIRPLLKLSLFYRYNAVLNRWR